MHPDLSKSFRRAADAFRLPPRARGDVDVYLSTGCADLDVLLGGGISRGEVTEVYGGAASGKTQLVLTLCRSATAGGGRALLIDADGSICVARIRTLALPEERVYLMRAASADHALAVLHIVLEKALNELADVRLLAVDSIDALFHACTMPNALRRLQIFVDRLSHLSVAYNCAVVVTNDAMRAAMGAEPLISNNEEHVAGPSALGATWQTTCPVRMALRQGLEDEEDRYAVLVAHPRVACGRASFTIGADGVGNVG